MHLSLALIATASALTLSIRPQDVPSISSFSRISSSRTSRLTSTQSYPSSSPRTTSSSLASSTIANSTISATIRTTTSAPSRSASTYVEEKSKSGSSSTTVRILTITSTLTTLTSTTTISSSLSTPTSPMYTNPTIALTFPANATANATTTTSLSPSAISVVAAAASEQSADPDLGATDAVTDSPFGLVADTTSPSLPVDTAACGPVALYFGQEQSDWAKYDMDNWLNTWVNKHAVSIRKVGFAAAFGEWATGNPDLTCTDTGSGSNCDFNPCQIKSYNVALNETRQVYYVMESINRLHSYFVALRESFITSGIVVALGQAAFGNLFYRDSEVKDVIAIREVIGASQTVFGLVACGLGFGPIGVALGGAALMTLFGGALGTIGPLLAQHGDNTYTTNGQVGLEISTMFVTAVERFTTTNNALLYGRRERNADPLSRDIRSYFHNGSFLAYPGLDKNNVTNQANRFLIAQSINSLWRQQKIYIMGGGACGDGEGIGSGPQNRMVCRDGKAWYLYYWQEEKKSIIMSDRAYGSVQDPPGASSLGRGMYAGITVTDVINSSLDAYIAAGYNYTNAIAQERIKHSLNTTFDNPLRQGPSFEGVFTIPVCDVGEMKPLTPYGKQYLLTPYGDDNRPMWCGPICGNKPELTRSFIKAANMENFQSPINKCYIYGHPDQHYTYCDKFYGGAESS